MATSISTGLSRIEHVASKIDDSDKPEKIQLHLNLLCIAGALLGLMSIFLIWGTRTYNQGFTLLDFTSLTSYIDGTMFFAVMFFISTLLAFISPLAGIGQFIGSIGYVIIIGAIPSNQTGEEWWGGTGLGAYVGLTAALTVILSAVFPLGIGYRRGRLTRLDRLLSISPYPPSVLRVNVLAVAGAILGLVAMALVWYTSWDSSGGDTLLQNLTGFWGIVNGEWVSSEGITAAAWIFLIGSLAAIAITPLGGLVMVIGDIVFLSAAAHMNSHYPGLVEPSLGFYIGVAAGIMVFASLFWPYGPGYETKKPELMIRLSTWGLRKGLTTEWGLAPVQKSV